MADGGSRAKLPWGMTKDNLKPNSVQSISQQKLKAFSLGMMNPLKRAAMKKKEEKKIDKKIAEAKETAEVFEQFVASFEDSGQAGKAFVRGSVYNPEKPAGMSERSKPGSVYKPSSRFQSAVSEEKPSAFKSPAVNQKPQKKKGTAKKKSILELFREELKRAQEDRKDRHVKKDSEDFPVDPGPIVEPGGDLFEVEEYKNLQPDSSDNLSTNLYVGNINPKMNEEMLCQMFGKFGPLASVKVMWPRTEEERAKRKNCGFVAFMRRADAEKALENFKGTTIMDYEAQVGWGKAVPLPPQAIYVPPDHKEDEKAKHPDPPSGLPFNAQPVAKKKSGYINVPPPGLGDSRPGGPDIDETLYTALIRVVIPDDIKLLRLIHRMIEFVIREGPMFEAMIMNREINNPMFQFLFNNKSPSHIYYRWKLFSILQGDSPETWHTAEFRMFENGSLWKPPPLKNLRMKMLPPVEKDVILQRGQLSSSNRDDLEDQLRHITMERASIRKSMVWCLDHADSAEEVVDCISEALTIETTPLPKKLARLFLVSDILHNCSSTVRYSSNYRRGFEGKLVALFEHFGTTFQGISSRMRSENFKRRILACVNSWDLVSVFHFNLLDKLKETFFGRTQEEMEKQKAFNTVAALMATSDKEAVSELDGVPLFDDRPIDFSGAVYNDDIDGEPLDEDIDGVPLEDPAQDPALTKACKEEDIDGEPLELPPAPVVKSKWELVDDDSDEEEVKKESERELSEKEKEKQKMQMQLEERKRQIKREVEVKVVELSAVLEHSGSYSKTEIKQRVDKYREKLMQEAVIPKMTPPSSPAHRKHSNSRSPSPSTLAKYELDDSPKESTKSDSPKPSPKRKRSLSPQNRRSRSRSPPPKKRKSSAERKRSRSPRKRSRSKSPRKRSKSPRKRSKSPRKRSKSPRKRSRSRSPRRRSRSPRRRRSRDRSSSPTRRRSRSPRSRKRSRSPKRRHRSRSPKSHRHRSRSKSPSRSSKRKRRSRSRSRSPQKSSRKSTKH